MKKQGYLFLLIVCVGILVCCIWIIKNLKTVENNETEGKERVLEENLLKQSENDAGKEVYDEKQFLEEHLYGQWEFAERIVEIDESNNLVYGVTPNLSELGVEELKEAVSIVYGKEAIYFAEEMKQDVFTDVQDMYLFGKCGGFNCTYEPIYEIERMNSDVVMLEDIYNWHEKQAVQIDEMEKFIHVSYSGKRAKEGEKESRTWSKRLGSDIYINPEDKDTIYIEFCGLWKMKRVQTDKITDSQESGGVNEDTFALIKSKVDAVDYKCVIRQGDLAKYDLYKKKFSEVLQCESPFSTKESGEVYLIEYKTFGIDNNRVRKNHDCINYDIVDGYSYVFCDMDGDGGPELCINDGMGSAYILKYEEVADRVEIWAEYTDSQEILTDQIEDFVRFKTEKHISPLGNKYKYETWFLVGLSQETLNSELRTKGVCDENGEYYFRVTEEQYRELKAKYDEYSKETKDAIERATFTYEELFGSIDRTIDLEKEDISEEEKLSLEKGVRLLLREIYSEEIPDFKETVDVQGRLIKNVLGMPVYEFKEDAMIYQIDFKKELCSGRYYVVGFHLWYHPEDTGDDYYWRFIGHYAVNRENGEVISERFKDEGTGEWVYNQEYRNIMNEIKGLDN